MIHIRSVLSHEMRFSGPSFFTNPLRFQLASGNFIIKIILLGKLYGPLQVALIFQPSGKFPKKKNGVRDGREKSGGLGSGVGVLFCAQLFEKGYPLRRVQMV